MKKTIDDYMTVKEAAYRWGVELRTLRERLNAKRRPVVLEEIECGLIKYFKAPDSKYGDWIISKQAMQKWYGQEPEKNKKN